MLTIRVYDEPQRAPADFRSLPDQVILKDGEGLFEQWHGSGRPTSTPCGACENTEGNLTIWANWGFSYPNGNRWDDEELVCGRCGRFTLVLRFTEG